MFYVDYPKKRVLNEWIRDLLHLMFRWGVVVLFFHLLFYWYILTVLYYYLAQRPDLCESRRRR